MSLAAKLPYDHPYAGGFPGIGSQPLPTDSDCLTYLAAVAAADGAGVEVGVAVSVDTFFRAVKAAGIYSDLKAAAILCGARTITGALVPLAGTAPTSNGFVSGDYSRTDGITGDGTSYLDSGRAADDDPQNDNHWAIYITTPQTVAGRSSFGSGDNVATSYHYHRTNTGANAGKPQLQNNVSANYSTTNELEAAGLSATSRGGSSSYAWASGGQSGTISQASVAPTAYNAYIFAVNSEGSAAIHSDAAIAFYSIGTDIGSAGLAALETAADNLISDIGAAL